MKKPRPRKVKKARNEMARELWTPKYKMQVVPDKRDKTNEKEHNDAIRQHIVQPPEQLQE